MAIGTALGIAGALGSGILGTVGQIASPIIQGEYNKNEAQKQRNWEERMSNTAIQRQIADARKAGISPALLLGGASTPSSSSASISNPNIGGEMSSSIRQMLNYIQEDRKLDAMEKMQDQRLETKQAMQNERLEHKVQMYNMAHSTSSNFMKHSREELLKDFWDGDNVLRME